MQLKIHEVDLELLADQIHLINNLAAPLGNDEKKGLLDGVSHLLWHIEQALTKEKDQEHPLVREAREAAGIGDVNGPSN